MSITQVWTFLPRTWLVTGWFTPAASTAGELTGTTSTKSSVVQGLKQPKLKPSGIQFMSKALHPVVKNKVGVNFCYLPTKVTSTGGGTYLTRALDARNQTGADVLVFMLPSGENAQKNAERIKRGREDLMAAVKPLILPFKIVVAIGSNQIQLEKFFEKKHWSDIKY